MSEKMPGFKPPKQESTENSPENEFEEHEDLIAHYERLNAEEAAKEKVDCKPYIEEFEEMIETLLEQDLLEALNALNTEQEALTSAERTATKEALVPLVKIMNFLKKETNIQKQELDRLHKKYKKVSRAVGIINNGIVDHNR